MVKRRKIHACHIFMLMIKLLVNSFLLLLSRHCSTYQNLNVLQIIIYSLKHLTCILFRAGNTKVHAFSHVYIN